MPLFKSNPDERDQADGVHRSRSASHKNGGSPTRKGTLFGGRRRSVSPGPSTSNSHRGGFFHRRSSSDDSSLGRSGTGTGSVRSGSSGGFFSFGNHNNSNDPTILAARQKVQDAEAAEKEADRALMAARAMVKEAKDHVKMLEREAEEE
jgi:hypothetical protein